MSNLCGQSLVEWREASDELIIQEMFRNKAFVDPCFINFVEKERPQAAQQYLNLFIQQGGTIYSKRAKKILGR